MAIGRLEPPQAVLAALATARGGCLKFQNDFELNSIDSIEFYEVVLGEDDTVAEDDA
jgi:hypothetical protein